MTIKKLLCFVLAFAMVLGTMSFTVFAEEAITVDSYLKLTADNVAEYNGKTINVVMDEEWAAAAKKGSFIIGVFGDVTLEGATITGDNISGSNGLFYINADASLTLKDCTVTVTNSPELGKLFSNEGGAASVVLDGTTIDASNMQRVFYNIGLKAVNSNIKATNLTDHVMRNVNGSIADTSITVEGAESLIKNGSDVSSFSVVGESEITVSDIEEGETAINGANVLVTSDAVVEGVDEETYTTTSFDAKVTSLKVDTYYETIEDAIASAKGDITVQIVPDEFDKDVTIKQTEGVNITLSGENTVFSGTIYVHGNARYDGEETLTIENINFATVENNHDFISSNTTASEERYAHNVTVRDCSFEATEAGLYTAVALRFRQSYNVSVENCDMRGLHSVMWATGGDGIAFDALDAADCKNGISVGTTDNVVVENAKIEAVGEYGYGVRADASGAYSLNIDNCELNANAPVLVRKASNSQYELSVSNSTLNTTSSDGYAIVVTKKDYDEENTLEGNSGVITVNLDDVTKYPAFSAHVAKNGNNLYSTLEAAVNEAEDGDTINLIADAVIDGTIKIDENITIEGNDNTIKVNYSVFPEKGTMISTSYPVVPTIKNVRFDADGRNGVKAIAFSANVQSCVFEGFWNGSTYGCWLGDGSTINECEFVDTFYSVACDTWTGGNVEEGETYNITNNIFRKDTTYGVNLGAAAHAVIEGNTFYGNWNSGNMANTVSYNNNTFVAINGGYNYWRFNSTSDEALKVSNTFTAEEGFDGGYTVNLGGEGTTDVWNVDLSGSVVLSETFDITVNYPTNADVNVFPIYLDEAKTITANVEVAKTATVGAATVEMPHLDSVVSGSDYANNAVISVSASVANPETKVILEDGQDVEYYDISIIKNGELYDNKTYDDDSKNQLVKVTLGSVVNGDITVKHWNGTSWENIASTTEGNTVTFVTDSFSPFAFIYNAGTLTENDLAASVTASLEKVAENEYNVVLTGDDDKVINRFMSAEFGIDFVAASGSLAASVERVGNVNIVYPEYNPDSELYEFNLNGAQADITGKKIVVAKVVLSGYGEGELKLVAAEGSMVNVEKGEGKNNVTTFTLTDNNLTIDAEPENIVLEVLKQTLTINVAFDNAIFANSAAYQDMNITIYGGDLAEDVVFELGDGAEWQDGKYTVQAALTQNNLYNVVVSGAGYRTARYTVKMDDNKVLNFWNDLEPNDIMVDETNSKSAMKSNFLAGDIVMDNDINIYDLSAVVAYFGAEGLVNNHPEYAKYDLNRDGVIDSKDVAYVLVSWDD